MIPLISYFLNSIAVQVQSSLLAGSWSTRNGLVFFFFFAGWFGCSNEFSCAARASWFFHLARLSLLGERFDTDRRRRRYHIEDLKLATATFSPLQPLPFLGPEPHLHRVVQYEENIFASSFEARLHSKVQHDHLPNVEVSFSEVRGTGRGLRSWFPYNMRACHSRRVSKARTGGLKRLWIHQLASKGCHVLDFGP